MLGSARGNTLTLECIVEAYPKPFLVWSFGGICIKGMYSRRTLFFILFYYVTTLNFGVALALISQLEVY